MRALVIKAGELCLINDEPLPECRYGEVLLRPLLAGVCNTDLELVQGYYAYEGILGHEFVAEVLDGSDEWRGKRVVGEINVACGCCDFCRSGVRSHCRNRTSLGIRGYGSGAFADVFRLPAINLHAVPETLTNEQAVFAEPLAAALEVLEVTHVKPSDRVVVLGAGKLGMLTAQVLRLTGASLVVIVRHQKQATLLKRWGIVSSAVEDIPPGQADLVVDCTGSVDGFMDAMHLLRPRGTLVLKSTVHGLMQANLSRIAVEEFRVVGSRCGPFPAALRLLEAGLVNVTEMIEATCRFEDAVTTFQLAAQPGALKYLLRF